MFFNVPNLRFKPFNEKYKEFDFFSVFKKYKTSIKSADRKEYKTSGLTPVVDQGSELIAGYVDRAGIKDDVIIFGDHTTNVKYIDFEFVPGCDGTQLLASSNKQYYLKYLYYLLDKNKPLQEGYKRHFPILKNFSFCIIEDIKEQHKIAYFFTLIDERIETQNKIIEEIKTLRKTIINLMIKRLYGNAVLVSVRSCISDYSVKTISDAEYPVLSSTAGGICYQNDYFKKEASSEDTTGYKKVPYGYCTYRSMSDTGRFYFNIQDITKIGIVSPAYPVFLVKDNSALFLTTVLNNDDKVINAILKQKAGGTRFSLPLKKLCEIQIPWPSKNERDLFIAFVRSLNDKMKVEQNILSKYLEQKAYLLSNLFI